MNPIEPIPRNTSVDQSRAPLAGSPFDQSPVSTPRGDVSPMKQTMQRRELEFAKLVVDKWMRQTFKH